jgi:hypothetical protein
LAAGEVKGKEEADELVEMTLVDLGEEYARGCVPTVSWKMIMGRKA